MRENSIQVNNTIQWGLFLNMEHVLYNVHWVCALQCTLGVCSSMYIECVLYNAHWVCALQCTSGVCYTMHIGCGSTMHIGCGPTMHIGCVLYNAHWECALQCTYTLVWYIYYFNAYCRCMLYNAIKIHVHCTLYLTKLLTQLTEVKCSSVRLLYSFMYCTCTCTLVSALHTCTSGFLS